jgi:hypothetical protein
MSQSMRHCSRPGVLLTVAAALALATLVSLLLLGRPHVRGETLPPSDDEVALLALINGYRLEHGLSALKLSPALSASARWMSEDMAEHNRLDHTDSLGRSASERMAAFGCTEFTLLGEIVGSGADTPEGAFEAWRNSSEHDAIMLTEGYVVAGVGKAYNPQSLYGWFWTVEFSDCVDSLSASTLPSLVPGPTEGQLVGCPAPGQWSLAVWSGQDDAPIGEALATCGAGMVDFAYCVDHDTQDWLRYFVGDTEISDLMALDNLQGVIAHGAMSAPPLFLHGPDADQHAEVSSSDLIDVILDHWGRNTIGPSDFAEESAAPGALQNCPPPGKWAISVWQGADGTDTGQALATCQAGSVAAAYYIDPDAQVWSRWFAGRPEVSDLQTVDDMQAIIALGADTGP